MELTRWASSGLHLTHSYTVYFRQSPEEVSAIQAEDRVSNVRDHDGEIRCRQGKLNVYCYVVHVFSVNVFETNTTNLYLLLYHQNPSIAFRASTVLLLVTPNDTTGSTEFSPKTLANHRNCVSLYINSKIAEVPNEPETTLTTGRLPIF